MGEENVVQAFEDMLYELKDRLREDDQFARELYCAICNMQWAHDDYEELYSCSWRYAGGLVADIRKMGEGYLDYYCSGYEGTVTTNVLSELIERGWRPVSYDGEAIPIQPSPLNFNCNLFSWEESDEDTDNDSDSE